MSEKITCTSCGMLFIRTIGKGLHPKDCPEGLDQECPSCDSDAYNTECKMCRQKQDMQRS